MTRATLRGASGPGIWLVVAAIAGAGASDLGCSEKRAGRPGDGAAVALSDASPPPAVAPPLPLTQINGQSFPDRVIALTWDDGPDRGTVALAEYLRRQKIAATFFVVSEWSKEASSDPGEGTGVYETGFTYLRVLEQLVGLGHRLGNHTLNHALLSEIDPAQADLQVRANQEQIDPLLTNELRLFRAPGGAWSEGAARAIAEDPYLAGLVGPIRWDVDRKDWESSRGCASDRPAEDCESLGPGRSRVKALVTARRYLESIEEAKRGIVLLHDRVGDVGSSYAIEVARALVPQLKARGFVFAPPVLGFSPLGRRAPREAADAGGGEEALVGVADVDGDRRADLCIRDGAGVLCAIASELAGSASDRRPRVVFQRRSRWDLGFGGADWTPPERARSIQLADVDGDRRADLCGMRGRGEIVCALATTPLAFATPRTWRRGGESYPSLLLGDVDGDGKGDACGRTAGGVECARSLGNAFGPARAWLAGTNDAEGWGAATDGAGLALADVDGDGRADVCGRGPRGIACALSRRTSFARAARWSTGDDFTDADAIPWGRSAAYGGTIRFGDLNGDGRADVCGRGPAGVVCALSTGSGFTRATTWLRAGMTDADGWQDAPPARSASFRLADVNGDGRADVCADSPAGVVCGLAP